MSKINIEFDTVDKTYVVLFDGRALNNVTNIYIYNDYDNNEKKHIEVCMTENLENEKIKVLTTVVAGKLKSDGESLHVDDFTCQNNDKVLSGAYKLFGRKYIK